LDIIGNKITVECVFNALPTSAAHLVTKHTGMEDINYALGVNGAEIKTANDGYVRVDVACETAPLMKPIMLQWFTMEQVLNFIETAIC
jgi:hypothetical protein